MLADFTVTKVVGPAIAAGLHRKIARPRFIRMCAAVCASARDSRTRRRKISALFGVQLLGSSPNNFDRALWHAPARLKSDEDSGKITAQ